MDRNEFALSFFTVLGKYVAARHADGVLAAKFPLWPGVVSRPAKPGEIISLYGNGFGPTVNSADLPARLQACPWMPSAGDGPCPVAVSFTTGNGQWTTSIADWAGLVGWGLYQINVKVPNLPDGDLWIVAGLGVACGPCSSYATDFSQLQTILITIQN